MLHLQINPQVVPVEERPGSFHAVMKNVMRNARLRVLSLCAAVQACPAASLAQTCARASSMCYNNKDPTASLCRSLTSEP